MILTITWRDIDNKRQITAVKYMFFVHERYHLLMMLDTIAVIVSVDCRTPGVYGSRRKRRQTRS